MTQSLTPTPLSEAVERLARVLDGGLVSDVYPDSSEFGARSYMAAWVTDQRDAINAATALVAPPPAPTEPGQ